MALCSRQLLISILVGAIASPRYKYMLHPEFSVPHAGPYMRHNVQRSCVSLFPVSYLFYPRRPSPPGSRRKCPMFFVQSRTSLTHGWTSTIFVWMSQQSVVLQSSALFPAPIPAGPKKRKEGRSWASLQLWRSGPC